MRSRVPNVHFYLVGANSDRMFGHLASADITVTGKLPSVLPYLRNVDVALVPLKFESGTRFQILEAGACRVPLVSTTLGAEGIPVADGEHILLADTPEAFAATIVSILRDPEMAQRLAENCRDLVHRKYSITYLREEARAILTYLGYQQIPS